MPGTTHSGRPVSYVAQNVGQIYAGALVAVAVLGFGVVRGLLWAREIRFFTVAMVLTLLYALGKYTPVFHLIYDFVPGVTLYRRPADATFVFCALLALLAGYLVHRLLTDTIPPPRRWQRAAEIAIAVALIGIAIGLALWVGALQSAALPILWGVGFAAAAIAALALARRVAARSALAAAAVLGGLQRRRSRLEQRAERIDRAEARRNTRRCARTPRTKPSRCSSRGSRPPPRPTAATASN